MVSQAVMESGAIMSKEHLPMLLAKAPHRYYTEFTSMSQFSDSVPCSVSAQVDSHNSNMYSVMTVIYAVSNW